MIEKYRDKSGLTWQQMNITQVCLRPVNTTQHVHFRVIFIFIFSVLVLCLSDFIYVVSYSLCSSSQLEFPDEAFDVICDKGTLDSILCGEGSTSNVGKALGEFTRVLKPQGVFMMLSYGIPDNRLSYLDNESYHWKVQVHTIAKPTVSASAVPDSKDASSVHYLYVCQKGVQAEE